MILILIEELLNWKTYIVVLVAERVKVPLLSFTLLVEISFG
jgi:hypothetical protein